MEQETRSLWLLGGGAALGLALATLGLVQPGEGAATGLPPDVVARVNGVEIRRDDYARLLNGLAQDTRAPVDTSMRRRVLDRMIDEELLVQRGLELGLARVDRRVRADLTSSLIASIVDEAEQHEPSERELAAFHAEEREFFTLPGRLHVRQIFFRTPDGDEADALRRAAEARAALVAGTPFAEVDERFGDPQVSPLPDVLLPASKVREYVGPSALRAAHALEVGEVSEPVRSGVGVHLLQLVDRTPSRVPPLDEIEEQVRREWVRRAGDRALRRYLDELRERADVVAAAVGDPGAEAD